MLRGWRVFPLALDDPASPLDHAHGRAGSGMLAAARRLLRAEGEGAEGAGQASLHLERGAADGDDGPVFYR